MPCNGPRNRSRLNSSSMSLVSLRACFTNEQASALYRGPKVSSRFPKNLTSSLHEISRFFSAALISGMVANGSADSSILVFGIRGSVRVEKQRPALRSSALRASRVGRSLRARPRTLSEDVVPALQEAPAAEARLGVVSSASLAPKRDQWQLRQRLACSTHVGSPWDPCLNYRERSQCAIRRVQCP